MGEREIPYFGTFALVNFGNKKRESVKVNDRERNRERQKDRERVRDKERKRDEESSRERVTLLWYLSPY